MRRVLCLLLALVVATPVLAGAPDASLRPLARVLDVPAEITGDPTGRPNSGAADSTMHLAAASSLAVARALRPAPRSQALVQQAMARQVERERGALCGDPAIQGEYVGYVPGRIRGCGVKDAVEVRSVAGVALSQRAVMHCSTAKALKTWVERGAKPAVGNTGGGIAELRVAAHYACRTRNNQPGAKISEHGKGRAIDISAVRLRDGTNLTVLGGYYSDYQGPILKRMYAAACGPFTTTLGPDSDRFHQDHFHFDTAKHRGGGRYCR